MSVKYGEWHSPNRAEQIRDFERTRKKMLKAFEPLYWGAGRKMAGPEPRSTFPDMNALQGQAFRGEQMPPTMTRRDPAGDLARSRAAFGAISGEGGTVLAEERMRAANPSPVSPDPQTGLLASAEDRRHRMLRPAAIRRTARMYGESEQRATERLDAIIAKSGKEQVEAERDIFGAMWGDESGWAGKAGESMQSEVPVAPQGQEFTESTMHGRRLQPERETTELYELPLVADRLSVEYTGKPITGALRLSAETTGLPVAGPAGGAGRSDKTLQMIKDEGVYKGLQESGGEVPFAPEVLSLANYVPLPFIDAAMGVALGKAFKAVPTVIRGGRTFASRANAHRMLWALEQADKAGKIPAGLRGRADEIARSLKAKLDEGAALLQGERGAVPLGPGEVPPVREGAGAAAGPPPRPPEPPAPTSPTGGPSLPERGTSGAQQAIDLKEETLLRPGRATQLPGIKQALSGLNPSVSMDRRVLASYNARQAVSSSLETEFAASRHAVIRTLQGAWDTAPPRYVGPKNNAIKNTIKDWADNPEFYADVVPELRAAARAYDDVSNQILARTRGEYGVDISAFSSGKDDAFYMPTVPARESLDDALLKVSEGYTSAGVSPNMARGKARVYEGAFQRAQRNPGFKAETDLAELTALHDRALATMGGNETFRLGVGGKTRLEAMEELHPKFYERMMGLRERVNGLRGTVSRLNKRAGEAIDEFLAAPDGDLRDLAEALDVRVQRGQFKGQNVKAINAELTSVRQELRALRPGWESANLEPYVMNRKTFRFHLPEQAAAIDKILLTKMPIAESLAAAIDEVRLTAFAADVSPLTIQGLLGILSDPITGARSLPSAGKTLFSPENILEVAAREPEKVRRFTMATGRPFGEVGSEFVQKAKGIERIPVVGPELNRRLMSAVELIRYNQWKTDTALLQKLGGQAQNVADAEAANSLSKVIPALNPAERGASVLQARVERIPVISTSFIGGPATVIKDAASGMAKLTASRSLSPVARWQALAGREQLAILHLSSIAGTLVTLGISSHVASGWSPEEAAKAVLDPNSPRFISIALGKDRRIPLGGPLRSAVRAFVPQKVGEVKGTPVYAPFAGVPQWLKGKVTPAIRAPVDLARNKDYFGGKIMTGSFPEQALRGIWYGVNSVLPLAAAEPSEAIRTGEVEPTDYQALAERGGAQLAGVDMRETSPFEKMGWSREAAMEEAGFGDYPGGWDQFSSDYPAEAARIDAQPKVAQDIERLDDRQRDTQESQAFEFTEGLREVSAEVQAQDDTLLGRGTMNGDTWRDKLSDRQRAIFLQREAIYEFAGIEFDEKEPTKGTPGAALKDYFDMDIDDYTDAQTGEVDWDKWFDDKDAALKPLSGKERRELEREVLHKFDTPTVREFRKARDVVDEVYSETKYKGLSSADSQRVEEFLGEVEDFQVAHERETGRELEFPRAVLRLLKSGTIVDEDLQKFIRKHFVSRPDLPSYITRPDPVNPRRDEIIIENQGLLSKFYPSLVESALNRSQEAELGQPAYERIGAVR